MKYYTLKGEGWKYLSYKESSEVSETLKVPKIHSPKSQITSIGCSTID